jgi:hypothetical protein
MGHLVDTPSGDGRDALAPEGEVVEDGLKNDAPPASENSAGGAVSSEEAKKVCSAFVSQLVTMIPNHLQDPLSPEEYKNGMIVGNAAVDVWFPDIEKYGKVVVTLALVAWTGATMLPRIMKYRRRKAAKLAPTKRARAEAVDTSTPPPDEDAPKAESDSEAPPERDRLDAGEDS